MHPAKTLLHYSAAALLTGLIACAEEAPTSVTGGPTEGDLVTAGRTGRPAFTRSFRMRGTVTFVGEVAAAPPCFLHIQSALAGHATHLGRFEGEGSTCIETDLSTALPDPSPPFLPPGPPPYITAVFSNPLWVLRASNGDELRLRTIEAVAVLSVDGSLRSEGRHEVIGGTGRFAGATGVFKTVGGNDGTPGPDVISSEGWIRY